MVLPTFQTIGGAALYNMYNENERISNTGSWLYDIDSDRFFFSENFYSMFDPTRTLLNNDLVSMATLFHPEDRHLLATTIDSIRLQQPVSACEFRLAYNGKALYIQQTVSFYTGDNAHIIIQGCWKDITCDKALAHELSFHHNLLDESIDSILVLDIQQNILLWNHRTELITGIDKKDAVGKPVAAVLPVMQEPKFVQALEHALKGFTSFVAAERNIQESGYSENHFIPIKEDNGTVTTILVIRHDVAHRVKAEEELQALNHSLAAKNRELKRRNAELHAFSHITSNDFKEPLRKIYTAIELLLTQEINRFSEKGRMQFKKIQGAVQRIGLLTDDILSYSRLDVEKTPVTDVDLNQVLSLVKKRLEDRISATNTRIISDTLPCYKGHRIMLAQLFQNILDNAIKFRQPGMPPEIIIKVLEVSAGDELHADAEPGIRYLHISFTDNGIGFDKKYAGQIFDTFMRIDKSNVSGSGAGLALCNKIVELHGGFILAESVPGKGSTFHCYLPLHN